MKSKTIHIHISDCDDNETFEMIVENAGLSRFDEYGDTKDNAETLSIEGIIGSDTVDEKNITFYREGGIDSSTFNEILDTFNQPRSSESINIIIKSARLS